MENYLIIEFVGLPGCGKSTVSHIVAKELEKKGIKVFEPSYSLDNISTPLIRKIKKILMTFLWMLCKPKDAKKLFLFLYKYQSSNFVRDFVSIAYKKFFVFLNKNKTCIILFDEGISQDCISLCMDNPNNFNKAMKEIAFIEKNAYLLLLEDRIDNALKNQDNRLTNDSNVEREHDFAKKELLMSKYLTCLNSVGDTNNVFKISDTCLEIRVTESLNKIVSIYLERKIESDN